MKEKLEKANELQKQIDELKKFLFVVVEFDEKSTAIPSVNVFMKKTIDVKIELFGHRGFGIGTHSQTVIIPNTLRNSLINSCKIRIEELETELSRMLY